MKVVFSNDAWKEHVHWTTADAALLKRLDALIHECRRSPFKGIRKPEPLKGNLKGWWSRRLTDEHRFVYRVSGVDQAQALEIAQCRSHY